MHGTFINAVDLNKMRLIGI